MHEFVAAWAAIDQRGIQAFLEEARQAGETARVSERFLDLVGVMSAEVQRLEFDREVEEALEEAKRLKRT